MCATRNLAQITRYIRNIIFGARKNGNLLHIRFITYSRV